MLTSRMLSASVSRRPLAAAHGLRRAIVLSLLNLSQTNVFGIAKCTFTGEVCSSNRIARMP
jgi:hypothetical protein